MTHVYFVRHAEPNCQNHDDALRELSPKGLADRALAAGYLRDKGVDAVLSSPYRRAVDTVAPLADALGLTVETVDGFRERAVGDWVEDFGGYSQRQWADFDYKLPGGESLQETQRRNLAALDGVLERLAGRTVAVGSHGTALSALIHHFRPAFGYTDFERIRPLMPWIVRFTFDGRVCVGVEEYNVFTGVAKEI